MNKQKSVKNSKTFFIIVALVIVFSAVYLIESELVSIKHSLQHEFKKSEGALISLHSHFGRLLPDDKEKISNLFESIADAKSQEVVVSDPALEEAIQKEKEQAEADPYQEPDSYQEPVVPEAPVIEDPYQEPEPVVENVVIEDPAVEDEEAVKPSILDRIMNQESDVELDESKSSKEEEDQNEEEEEEEIIDEPWMHVDVELNDFLKTTKPPNNDFIFHNKLPKSGSSTMNNVLKVLSKEQKFNFRKVEPIEVALHENQQLVDLLKKEIEKPFLLLKHHYFFDFTKYGMDQPTYINVIRDPLEWFTSRFYFSRYGWNRKPGCRDELCGMTEDEKNMSIDECVERRHPQCTDSSWYYFPFICGGEANCLNETEEAKMKAFETAKSHVMNDYYFVGILEQFEETLLMLNHLLPSYFNNADPIWKGEFVQHKQELTRTQHKQEMNEASRKFFLEGPLKYEKMFYDFTRKVFNERLKYYKIEIPEEEEEEY